MAFLKLRTNVSFPFSPTYWVVFNFEDDFDAEEQRQWMVNNWYIVIYFIMLYLVLIFGGRALMAPRKRKELRYPLAAWNTTLAIFSFVGFLRTSPEFVHVLTQYGFHHSVCNRSYADYDRVSRFWGFLFAMSKIPEFVDTAFVVLRKRDLIFLHYYHHVTTAFVLWFGYPDHSSIARWTVVMNYLVHSIMYSYFALRTLRFSVPRSIAMFITTSQIVQMFVGILLTYYVQMTLWRKQKCDVGYHMLYSSMIIYGSYFILFVHFFVNTYLSRPNISQCSTKVASLRLKSNGIIEKLKYL